MTIERSGGGPLPDDYLDINPATGQQKAYVVLSPEERAKGFVRPVRRSYIHKPCGTLTTMAQDIAETYARNPKFYSGTFCCGCKTHYPLNEFVWDGTDEVMGSDVEVKPLPAPLRDLIAEAEANAVAPMPGLVRPRIEVTDQMVSRFLCMPLPRTFSPDGAISFQLLTAGGLRDWPVGTNLFTAEETKAILDHVLNG